MRWGFALRFSLRCDPVLGEQPVPLLDYIAKSSGHAGVAISCCSLLCSDCRLPMRDHGFDMAGQSGAKRAKPSLGCSRSVNYEIAKNNLIFGGSVKARVARRSLKTGVVMAQAGDMERRDDRDRRISEDRRTSSQPFTGVDRRTGIDRRLLDRRSGHPLAAEYAEATMRARSALIAHGMGSPEFAAAESATSELRKRIDDDLRA
jgi:hypothetical protein